MTSTTEQLTEAQLRDLLRHPNGMIRSLADWTREYRGWGWRRQWVPNALPVSADQYERRLRVALAAYETKA